MAAAEALDPARGIDRFAGRVAAVATRHGKESAIGPALLSRLPLAEVRVIDDLDTDRFGAFSGEVAREQDPLEACQAKARYGAQVSGLDLIVASEGSFAPYPPAPFIPCDEEHLVLFDARDGQCFTHRHVALETVFGGECCTSIAQVLDFAARMRFPGHGLVLRSAERWMPGMTMHKGIADREALLETARQLIAAHGSCWVETDMRAMMNPTRMQVIAETARAFADELARACPACGACWFAVRGVKEGLPCVACGWPTQSIVGQLRGCWCCGHQQFAPRPDGKTHEDPLHCGNCNP
ncbi:MAG: hypothetical protein H6591_09145 [Flavobacteriales bacterium]|nr:hypothetical protein [Flavobacteriales bacterium]